MTLGSLNYLVPDGRPNRRFVAPGAEMNTGRYEARRVGIHDARTLAPAPTLASHGFELLDHVSAVTDFASAAEVDRLYLAEADALVRRITGAALTIPFGWMLRTAGASVDGRQPPAADVHVDLTPDRAERAAAGFLKRDGHDLAPSRFAIFSLWRAFSPPPQDWPLALCAGWSVGDDEGVPNTMIHVETLPEGDAALAPIAGEDGLPAASVFAWNGAHRWFYYPVMTRDEAVLITFYDSARGRCWRVPHTAFNDPSAHTSTPRQSIELRTIAYWS